MNLIIHSYNPSKTINWASGTSTELFIYPSDGNFQTREFKFRISTATVEADETKFSDFTGLIRILMVLRGRLTLIHEGRYERVLETFDQDTFDGSWKTRSKGRVQDFNVMCNSSCEAKVVHHRCMAGEKLQLATKGHWTFLFVFDGVFKSDDKSMVHGDLIEFQPTTDLVLDCIESGNCIEIVITEKD